LPQGRIPRYFNQLHSSPAKSSLPDEIWS